MKRIILYILRGIGLGCVFFTLSGIIFDIIFKGSFLLDHWYYTKMAIGSMVTGIAFYVPALVYQNEMDSFASRSMGYYRTYCKCCGGIFSYLVWILFVL